MVSSLRRRPVTRSAAFLHLGGWVRRRTGRSRAQWATSASTVGGGQRPLDHGPRLGRWRPGVRDRTRDGHAGREHPPRC